MRVVMYVLNDVTRDSRVLREAGTLAAAGHQVTVIGSLRTPDEPSGSREQVGGFTIVRTAIPSGDPWWTTYLRRPWRSVGPAVASARDALGRGPTGWLRALTILLGVALSMPWILLRGAWYGTVNRLLHRPLHIRGLEYLRRWQVETMGWAHAAVALAPPAEIHHAHDMEALPAAQLAARRDGTRFVYDSHEIFMAWGPITRQPRWLRWAMARRERSMAREAVALVTVNQAIARELARRLGPRRVVVVHNCPPRWEPPQPPEDRLRRAAGISAQSPVVLCHGGFQPGRGLEETAAAMLEPGLDGAHLVFLGFRPGVLEPILADGRLEERVHYLPGVLPAEVTAWVAGADVDVMAILPADLNSILSTPNKLFESLAAGVPVVSSDFPERRRIVLGDPAGPLGALCDPAQPASIAAAIRSVLELDAASRAELRARCLSAAHERWNWEQEGARLVGLYAELAAS
ncbi:MAG: glycosyltransferase [Candidatus Limnocylindrales bacterium]